MPHRTVTILCVESVPASSAFYTDLLDRPPAGESPGFALFPLPRGGGLGLWARAGVVPAPAAGPGGRELAFTAADVDAAHADWAGRGLRIAQPPTTMEFGRTFLALDPDGHRLRVFAPAGGAGP